MKHASRVWLCWSLLRLVLWVAMYGWMEAGLKIKLLNVVLNIIIRWKENQLKIAESRRKKRRRKHGEMMTRGRHDLTNVPRRKTRKWSDMWKNSDTEIEITIVSCSCSDFEHLPHRAHAGIIRSERKRL